MKQFMVIAFSVVAVAALYYLFYLPHQDNKRGGSAKDLLNKVDKK